MTFLEVSNPRVVLERALRKFTCLTVGDVIQIQYSNEVYYLRVIELKPANAVSIVETGLFSLSASSVCLTVCTIQ